MLTDDIVAVTDAHVPKLEESMTELFFGDETIYVIPLQYIHQEGLPWLWSAEFMMFAAWRQRGYIPYDHLRWEHARIREGGLPVPLGNPVEYRPIMVLRGGMPRIDPDNPMSYIQDPKKAMHY